MAAHKQGKFWEYHDKLFQIQNLSPASFTQIAKELGLDMARFDADMKSKEVQEKIMSDLQNARTADVNSTPSVFINGWRYRGQRSPMEMQQVVDRELARISKTKK